MVLNPCWERAAWLGASHDVTAAGGGWGRPDRSESLVWVMGGSEAAPGVPHAGPPHALGPLVRGLSRLLSPSAPSSTLCPAEESWRPGLVITIAACCASLVFLAVLVIICYKAIKR